MRDQMERLIATMLDGRILLGEAAAEFEKIYIQTALERNGGHLSQTSEALGIHRNTLAKRVAGYNGTMKKKSPVKKPVNKVSTRKPAKKRK